MASAVPREPTPGGARLAQTPADALHLWGLGHGDAFAGSASTVQSVGAGGHGRNRKGEAAGYRAENDTHHVARQSVQYPSRNH